MASFLSSTENWIDEVIGAEAQPECVVCGEPGVPVYENLGDRFFGASGRWNLWRCPDPQCATIWLNPRPLERDIGKAYRNYYTHHASIQPDSESPRGSVGVAMQAIKRAYIEAHLRYAENQIGWREWMLGALAFLDPTRRADTDFPLKYLPIEHRGRLLDLGCGSGDLLGRMRSSGWQAEGVDNDPVAVNAARRNGFTVRMGSLHQQRYPDASFDAVVMSHVIEHVHHPVELLREVHRILKPARHLVIATPNARSLGHRILGPRWPLLDPPRHLQIFTPRSLSTLVRAAGFKIGLVNTEVRTAAAIWSLMGKGPRLRRLLVSAENLAVHFDRDAGEEIVLVAVR